MLDFTKPVQTRDGHRVRIICTDRKWNNGLTIIGLVDRDGEETINCWYGDGNYTGYSDFPGGFDLVNVPQRHVHADLIIAWANGAKIQVYMPDNRIEWQDMDDLHIGWNPKRTYRVKP